MKILRITGSYIADEEFGGSVIADYETDNFLRDHGHQVDIFSLSNKNIKNCKNVTYFRPFFSGNYRFSFYLLFNIYRSLGRYDLIIITGVWDPQALISSYALSFTKKKYLIIPHGGLNQSTCFKQKKFLKKILLKVFINRSFKYANKLHYTNIHEYESSIYKAGDKIISPFPLKNIKYLRKVKNINNYPVNILFIGRITWKKGVDLLFKLIEINKTNIFFHICGSDDEGLLSKWESKLRREKKILNNYKFHGFVSGNQKKMIFEQSDIYLLPTYNENFGIATYEALAYGLPILISPNTALSDEIYQFNAGLEISLQAEDVSSKIEILCHDHSKIDLMSRNAQILAKKYRDRSRKLSLINEYENI